MPTTKPPALPEGTHTDFASSLSYRDYLHLDAILSSQKPLTAEHDELLFIIIHQATELWLKLVLHELAAARERLSECTTLIANYRDLLSGAEVVEVEEIEEGPRGGGQD